MRKVFFDFSFFILSNHTNSNAKSGEEEGKLILVIVKSTVIEVGDVIVEQTKIVVDVRSEFPDEMPFVPLYPNAVYPNRGCICGCELMRIIEAPIMELATFADFLRPNWLVTAAIWAANEANETARARRLVNRVIGGQRRIRSGALIEGKQEFEIREPVAFIAA